MDRLLLENVRAVLPHGVTQPVSIRIVDGKIREIGENMTGDCPRMDGMGLLAFPGFVDVHIHGGGGADFMDGTPEAFETVVSAHLPKGTTTLVPTAMTASREELLQFIHAYHRFKESSPYAVCVPGLHLEGPYFSGADGKSKGAQKAELIRPIDPDEVETLLTAGEGAILRWDAAPELQGSHRFAQRLCRAGVICAAAHTDATGYEAQAGFAAGFSHVTHFYNACTAYKKREQKVTAGIVEAAYLDDSVTVELICDGRHIPEHCLKLALKIKGPDRVLGITDATRLSCTDAKEGMLGSLRNGTPVIVDDGVAKLPDMTSYAGSTCTMDRALRVLCADYGIDPVTAAKMLATNPARHIGLLDSIGTLEPGKFADIVLTDDAYAIQRVIHRGNVI